MVVLRFWVYEGRNFSWEFEEEISSPSDIDQAAQRIDLIARSASAFFREIPPSEEEKEVILKLMRAVWTRKAEVLLADLL